MAVDPSLVANGSEPPREAARKLQLQMQSDARLRRPTSISMAHESVRMQSPSLEAAILQTVSVGDGLDLVQFALRMLADNNELAAHLESAAAR